MKRLILLLTVVALMTAALAGPASAQNYCWAYDYWYGWYWYYC